MHAAAISGHDAFQLLKGLAGEWSGTVTDADSGPPVTVIYRVTAGGSAVEELLFPGTSHEMVTMYHLDLGRLVLTHYCAMGNQPRMALSAGSTPEKLSFDFESAGNLASPDATHMHSGWIRILNADRIEAAWDIFEKGAEIAENRFFLTRKRQ
jgi:hypothetical protein